MKDEIVAYSARTDDAYDKPSLSVVVPFYNEEGNVAPLLEEIAAALGDLPFEIVAVDDGSTDGTPAELDAMRRRMPALRVLRHARNAGQSRAVRSAVKASKASIIATLDGDRQNVPADLVALYRQLTRNDAPADLAMIGGVRQGRQDHKSRLLAAKVATAFRRKVLSDDSEDTGCGLKVFKRDAFLDLPYFDHVHRYLPVLMRREGYSVEYAPVAHRSRGAGHSKYSNIGRALVAIRDVMGVVWLQSRARSPGSVEEDR